MSKSKRLLNKNLRGLFWIVAFAAAIYLIVRHISVFGNILLVLFGFGAVVIVHEFGHFIIAKLSGIKVEAFSIFMPPTLMGIRKTEDGFRIRVLPKLFSGENDESDGLASGGLDIKLGNKGKAGETEYRIGLIPFGGYVKMLGQDDTGPVKSSNDPRSFSNKPVSTRIPVIAAGVTFNIISAVIIFMIVFLIGIKLPPAVVGNVVPDSPAAQAGLRPGDEIIEIAGKSKDLDFSNILIAAALSDEGQEVPLRVRHDDGSEEDVVLIAERLPGKPMRDFGINIPQELTVAEVSDANALLQKTGLLPGDRIRAVDGKDVQSHWELEEIVEISLAPEVTLLAERTNQAGQLQLVESKIRLELIISDSAGHIYSMVPRFRMENLSVEKSTWMKISAKVRQLLENLGIVEEVEAKPFLQSGDIILSIGEVVCPTFEEFREVVKNSENKELPIKVLRADANGVESKLTISVTPKRDPDINEARIGISFLKMYDFKHPVIAKTIEEEGEAAQLDIPRGAEITAVNEVAVSSFYDVIRQIRHHAGQRIKIDYVDGKITGSVFLDAVRSKESINVKSTLAEFVPFKAFEITYRASGPIHAITMGYRRTVMFVAQTYLTLKRLVGGVVSPKHLMGPVGIMAFSYRLVAEQPLVDYIYLLGLISAAIAVFNLLPLPPLDGGLIALLLLERIKGSALSERTQGIIAYTGWVLIGTFLLYITFNDVVRSFFS
jgi:regulator of sigma E protease